MNGIVKLATISFPSLDFFFFLNWTIDNLQFVDQTRGETILVVEKIIPFYNIDGM